MLTLNQGKGGDKPPYTKTQATHVIKDISRDPKGSFRSTNHARDKMKELNISTQDIRHIFKNGKVLDEP